MAHDNNPTGFLKLARVKEVITGKDGQVRGSIVMVNLGRNSTVLRRPLKRLYPLEVGWTGPNAGCTEGARGCQCWPVCVRTRLPIFTAETAVSKHPTRVAALASRRETE